ncbi:hypothetical protein Tco_0546737 [Tanacetum coccineum]
MDTQSTSITTYLYSVHNMLLTRNIEWSVSSQVQTSHANSDRSRRSERRYTMHRYSDLHFSICGNYNTSTYTLSSTLTRDERVLGDKFDTVTHYYSWMLTRVGMDYSCVWHHSLVATVRMILVEHFREIVAVYAATVVCLHREVSDSSGEVFSGVRLLGCYGAVHIGYHACRIRALGVVRENRSSCLLGSTIQYEGYTTYLDMVEYAIRKSVYS